MFIFHDWDLFCCWWISVVFQSKISPSVVNPLSLPYSTQRVKTPSIRLSSFPTWGCLLSQKNRTSWSLVKPHCYRRSFVPSLWSRDLSLSGLKIYICDGFRDRLRYCCVCSVWGSPDQFLFSLAHSKFYGGFSVWNIELLLV